MQFTVTQGFNASAEEAAVRSGAGCTAILRLSHFQSPDVTCKPVLGDILQKGTPYKRGHRGVFCRTG